MSPIQGKFSPSSASFTNSTQANQNAKRKLDQRLRASLKRGRTLIAALLVFAALATGGLVVSGRAAGLNLRLLTSFADLFAGVPTQNAGPLAPAAVCTWNGTVDINWATAANWTGCTGGGVPAATDSVLLDNSIKAGSYAVSLPTGAVSVAIVKLTITPGAANTITLTLPATNTGVPGFSVGDATTATDDIILNSGAVLKNSSGAASGNGIEANSTANGTVRINNGARYIHNSARSTAGTVPLLSTAVGTETGIYEYDSPGTGSIAISASTRNYGSLTLTRTAGAAIYTATGGSPLTVRGDFLLNAGVTYNTTMTGALNLAGNLTNNGAALSIPSSEAVNFNGNTTASGSASITIASATSTVAAGSTLALGAVTFANTGTLTIAGTLQINQGGFPGGAGTYAYNAATGTLVYNNSAGTFSVNNDTYWPVANGPQNVRVQGAGGIQMNVARTIGTSLQYAAGVSSAGNLTLNGLSQINSGGFVSGSPTYGVNALLKYNTGATYGRNGEWLPGAISGAGYPRHVQLSNNTILDLPNSSTSSPFQMAGDLTIDAGSTMQLAGSTPLANTFTVFGNVTINGTFNLSTNPAGHLNIGGAWTNNATFNNNGRTVNLNGSIGQTISGNSSFFNLTKASSTAQTLTFAAGSTQTVSNSLTLSATAPLLLSLRSSAPGTQWKLIAPATQSVSFVDVQDSDASGGATVNATSSVNSGNNINWNIPLPALNIANDPTVTEGNAGTVNATFNVTLTPASGQTVTVHYLTQDSSATVADNDYVAIADTLLTFLPGETSKNINVTVNGDTTFEPNEQFFFNITTPSNANISDNQGIGTITNDDAAPPDYSITTTGSAIVVTDNSGNSDTLAMTEPVSGSIKFAAAGRFFSVDGGAPINGDSGNLSLTAANSVTVNQGNGDDTLNVGAFTLSMRTLTINGGNGNDTVNLNGSLTFLAGNSLDVDLQNDTGTPGVDSVNIGTNALIFLTTTGTATIKASRNFTMASGATLQVENGDLTIEGNRQATATAGDFNGVDLAGGQIISVGSGNISLKGTGGAGDFIENSGVLLKASALVQTTSSGTIDVQGTGGNGTGSASAGQSNLGVYVTLSSAIISSSGALTVTGTGGTTNDSNVLGVTVDELGKLETDGAGTLTINGTGGNVVGGGSPTFVNSGGVFIVLGDVNGDGGLVKSTGTGANAGAINITGLATAGGNGAAQGVRVDGPASVTTVDGPINITGTAAACGNACLGTSIRGPVTATGTGAISLTGTGAASTGAFPTHGTNIRSGGVVSSVSGNISITGTGGNGTDNAGFNLASTGTGTVQTTGAGTISVVADNMRIAPTASATINAGSNAVTLLEKTNTTIINLGGNDGVGTLGLTDGELDRITAGTINFGNATTLQVFTSAAISRAAATVLNLTDSANIFLGATGSLTSGGGNVKFTPGAGGKVSPVVIGVDVNMSSTGTVSFASGAGLDIAIQGTTVDSQYTQLNVVGLINLSGVNLVLSGPFSPAAGQTFTIVNNDGADAITGTFNGLSQGAVITNFLGSGLNATISYSGGDGNDVVLTVVPCTSIFNVNDGGDAFDVAAGDGVCATAGAVCTLRAAIQEANATPTSCGVVNINFSLPSATISVASELAVTHSININGPAANSITVSGTVANPTRVFHVTAGTVSLSNLTISGARVGSGGGLLVANSGTIVTLSNLLFTGNTVVNGSGGGAGVTNSATLNVRNSTFSGNTATNGGALYNGGGTLNLVNVTVTSNNASGDVGTGACGGASEGGGLDNFGANPTFVRNSIIAGNTACTAITEISGPITNQGNNILSGNPLLGALQNNGGPTFTHAVLYNSPAVDAGNDCVFTNSCVPALGVALTADQRGLSRNEDGDLVAGAHVDIGAYERGVTETRFFAAGSGVQVDLNDARLTYTGVNRPDQDGGSGANDLSAPDVTARAASISVIDPAAQGTPPAGYSVGTAFNPALPAFDVSTSASYTAPVGICFYLPAITDGSFFAGLRILHNEGGVLVDPGSTVIFNSKLVCTQVSSFSAFVIAHTNAPTAANGAISGKIVDDHGMGVAGAAVRLTGTQNRLTVTDEAGNYRFAGVETSGFYTATPSRANYTFSPAQRSFSQLGQHTDAAFTAEANLSGVNPLDTTEYFVRQQYLDFLGREPDEAGLNFWVNNIETCGAAGGCRQAKRTDTSAAFFLSIEFQRTGYLVYRMYQSAYGDLPGAPVPVTFGEFRPDTQAIGRGVVVNENGWQDKLEANKQAFATAFVNRARFVAGYPGTLSPAEFADKLFANARLNPGGAERLAVIGEFGSATDTKDTVARARALRRVAEAESLVAQEFNRAFVLMQYFGYLGRDANGAPDGDFSGYTFWLNKLQSFNGDFRSAEMVRAFLVAGEYRGRFPR